MGNQGYTYMVLHYQFLGLLIKPFLKKVHLVQRNSRQFVTCDPSTPCLYLPRRFFPAMIFPTLILAHFSLPCSRIFLLAVLHQSVPPNTASPMLKRSSPSRGCRGFYCSPIASLSCQEFIKISYQCFSLIFVYQIFGVLIVSLGL